MYIPKKSEYLLRVKSGDKRCQGVGVLGRYLMLGMSVCSVCLVCSVSFSIGPWSRREEM